MTMFARRFASLVFAGVVLALFAMASPAHAEPSVSGPLVTLDHDEAAPGDRLVVTISGFEAGSVTIAICGNEALRGSADCNMINSKGVRVVDSDAPTVTQVGVFPPPVGCPCLVRVSSQNNADVAVAPLVVVGHPIEPLVGGPSATDPLVVVSISAHAAPRGALQWIRSNLGGRVNYHVTVTVKNVTNEPLRHVTLFGSVGRSASDALVALALDDPGEIGPGRAWKQVVSVEVPVPSFGTLDWRVAASGAGPRVMATSATRHRPALLLALATLLVVDVAVVAIRSRMRRRARRDSEREHSSDGGAVDGGSTDAVAPADEVAFREPVAAGA